MSCSHWLNRFNRRINVEPTDETVEFVCSEPRVACDGAVRKHSRPMALDTRGSVHVAEQHDPRKLLLADLQHGLLPPVVVPAIQDSNWRRVCQHNINILRLSLIHISEPTRLLSISYAVFCLKKKKRKDTNNIATT
eukprot:TRINITY_DN15090_c0_g2_i1.p1 TRINITY_DN15090_c0_g2~~TRINITY_DN15090_c0_g2_i1.p1  ORF type:complete len:136 (+),score=14.28 TRINITY_DN15090_c0_g2_i1:44-451(+)